LPSFFSSPSSEPTQNKPVKRLGLRREAQPACSSFVQAALSSSRTLNELSQLGKRERVAFFAMLAIRNGAARVLHKKPKQAVLSARPATCHSQRLFRQPARQLPLEHSRNQASRPAIPLQSHAAVASGLPSFLSCCPLSFSSQRMPNPSFKRDALKRAP